MLPAHVSLARSWRFLPLGYTLEYSINSPLPSFSLPILVDGCINSLLPKEVFQQKPILDIKGRDAQNLIDSSIADKYKPLGDELMFVSGQVFLGDSSAWSEQANLVPQLFEIRLHTQFLEFKGIHHILHSPNLQRHGDLPHDVPLQALGKVFPLKIDRFRLGIDIFQSKFLSGILGFAPIVTQTLLLECDEANFNLKITAEGFKDKTQIPLARNNILDELDLLLKKFFDFSLIENIKTPPAH